MRESYVQDYSIACSTVDAGDAFKGMPVTAQETVEHTDAIRTDKE